MGDTHGARLLCPLVFLRHDKTPSCAKTQLGCSEVAVERRSLERTVVCGLCAFRGVCFSPQKHSCGPGKKYVSRKRRDSRVAGETPLGRVATRAALERGCWGYRQWLSFLTFLFVFLIGCASGGGLCRVFLSFSGKPTCALIVLCGRFDFYQAVAVRLFPGNQRIKLLLKTGKNTRGRTFLEQDERRCPFATMV